MFNYSNVVLAKPWGEEFICLETDVLSIWQLKLNYKGKTSLHLHKNKKTILLVLDGVIRLSFLNDSRLLSAGDGINVHKSVFHSSECITKSGAILLEVETPKEKEDILRLTDIYGRSGQPFNPTVLVDRHPVSLKNGIIGECSLNFLSLNSVQDINNLEQGKIIILKGGLHRNNVRAIGEADLTDSTTFVRLAESFEMDGPMEILHISKL